VLGGDDRHPADVSPFDVRLSALSIARLLSHSRFLRDEMNAGWPRQRFCPRWPRVNPNYAPFPNPEYEQVTGNSDVSLSCARGIRFSAHVSPYAHTKEASMIDCTGCKCVILRLRCIKGENEKIMHHPHDPDDPGSYLYRI